MIFPSSVHVVKASDISPPTPAPNAPSSPNVPSSPNAPNAPATPQDGQPASVTHTDAIVNKSSSMCASGMHPPA